MLFREIKSPFQATLKVIFLIVFGLCPVQSAPTGFDSSNEESVKSALNAMAGVLMPYYLNNNYQGSVTENYVSKGVDGFQW